MSPGEHTLVFVYGTLLSGERNHVLLRSARLVARAITAPRYTLVDLGHYPAMLDVGRTAIVGEVYRVDEETLARLDELEGHPSFYERRDIVLARGPRGAQGYLLATRRSGASLIVSGDWRAHRDEQRRARDPIAAGLADIAHGRLTPRAVALLVATSAPAPRGPKRRA